MSVTPYDFLDSPACRSIFIYTNGYNTSATPAIMKRAVANGVPAYQ